MAPNRGRAGAWSSRPGEPPIHALGRSPVAAFAAVVISGFALAGCGGAEAKRKRPVPGRPRR